MIYCNLYMFSSVLIYPKNLSGFLQGIRTHRQWGLQCSPNKWVKCPAVIYIYGPVFRRISIIYLAFYWVSGHAVMTRRHEANRGSSTAWINVKCFLLAFIYVVGFFSNTPRIYLTLYSASGRAVFGCQFWGYCIEKLQKINVLYWPFI